jgi:uncharacterized protein (DUF1778 family)
MKTRKTTITVEVTSKQAEWIRQAAHSFRCSPGDFLLASAFADMSGWAGQADEAIISTHSAILTFVDEGHVPDLEPDFQSLNFKSVAAG